MKRFIARSSVLQAGNAQCQFCFRRDLMSVLIAKTGGGYGRNKDRAYYLCEPDIAGYLEHDCRVQDTRSAA